jgi:hypothetical protein
MKKITISTLFFVSLFYNINASAECSDNAETKVDDFSKKTTVIGGVCKDNPNPSWKYEWTMSYLISVKPESFGLVMNVHYDDKGWRRYLAAVDDAGNNYTGPIDRKVSKCSGVFCSYSETMVVDLTFKQVETMAEKGLNIRMDSANPIVSTMNPKGENNRIFQIPAEQAKNFLDAYKNAYGNK